MKCVQFSFQVWERDQLLTLFKQMNNNYMFIMATNVLNTAVRLRTPRPQSHGVRRLNGLLTFSP